MRSLNARLRAGEVQIVGLAAMRSRRAPARHGTLHAAVRAAVPVRFAAADKDIIGFVHIPARRRNHV
jgi:hypothetical protein